MTKISVVVPLYNEEKVINDCYKRLTGVLTHLHEEYELVFVNDGSHDKTEEEVRSLATRDGRVKLINFARNFGHQTAITAGMDMAEGDAVIVIDADLQDPPEIIVQMVDKWHAGAAVVYGKRKKRKGETFLKKFTAAAFYRILKLMTSIDIPVDTGDFRLIDRKVCDVLKKMREKNRYIRGLVSFAGFKQESVEYIRQERFAGETKYSFKKMLRLASDGIISFSTYPLKISYVFGSALCAFTFIYYIVMLCTGCGVQTLGISLLLFIDGIILICIGILGEYVGRIYDECKNRPIYIIKDTVGINYNENN